MHAISMKCPSNMSVSVKKKPNVGLIYLVGVEFKRVKNMSITFGYKGKETQEREREKVFTHFVN